MLSGTEREVLELLFEHPRSPTEIADELGVSVQTASRNLKKLVDREFAERTRDSEGRGYKRYRAREFTRVLAGFDNELFDRTLELTPEKRAVLSVWQVPQTEFHSVLLSWLFSPDDDYLSFGFCGAVVYGSVARGTATPNSDLDLFVLYSPDEMAERHVQGDTHADPNEHMPLAFSIRGKLASDERRVVSEEWFSVTEFHNGLDAGSQFLHNVLDEGIVLYDPEGVIRDAKQERTGERVPQ